MALKVKFRTLFPALVSVASPLLLVKTGLAYAFSLDMNALIAQLTSSFEPIHAHIDQLITSGASAVVQTNAETVRVNKTVGSATALTMLAAANYEFDVLIADWKNDAGTNFITITPTAPETIQGQASLIIASNGGSVCLRPIAGVGFAI